jgi:hypothetical protein
MYGVCTYRWASKLFVTVIAGVALSGTTSPEPALKGRGTRRKEEEEEEAWIRFDLGVFVQLHNAKRTL